MDSNIFISESFSEALVFTLLHSIWQASLIYLVLRTAFRLGLSTSTARYNVSLLSMILITLMSIGTFGYYYLVASPLNPNVPVVETPSHPFVYAPIEEATSVVSIASTIGTYKYYILLIWAIGAAIFLVRLGGSWWYLRRMVNRATEVSEDLSVQLIRLRTIIGINKIVRLAQSASITTPMVIGFFKPVILLPLGLTSGISTAQLEAILIHELTHIRRNDFIINLLQTLIESIFFFNPFVWLISSIVHAEREHCCDDAVIEYGADAKAYVLALAALEQNRLTFTQPALSLAGNKNQLLTRIKRLMEKSVRHYSIQERIVPVALLVIGLICASWFSIQKDPDHSLSSQPDKLVQADTVIKKKEKTATYKRSTKTTVGSDGTPKEEVVEEFNGHEELRPILEDFAFNDFEVPPMPAFPPLDFEPGLTMSLMPGMDSIPFPRTMHAEMMAFQKKFSEKFQERFAEFYKEHQLELDRFMKEIEQDIKENELSAKDYSGHLQARRESIEAHEKAMEQRQQAITLHQSQMKEFEMNMKEWEERHAAHLKELEANMKKMEGEMKAFEDELRPELEKDGYLKSGEKIKSMMWDDEESMRINGKEIAPEHREKYTAMHKKHFEGSHHFNYSE